MGRPPPPPQTLPPPRHPLKIQPFEDFDDDDEDLRLGPPPSRPLLPRTALQDRCPNLRRRPEIECGSAANRNGGEGRRGWTPPPKGHLAVYVGGEKEGGPPRRYMVPVIYFNHPLFGELLREAEEEFGFHHPGGITIPCPAAKFERVRSRIAAGSERLRCKRASSLLSS